MLPTKVAVIGAASAIFGLNTVAALMRSQRLRGSHLALVDRNVEALEAMGQLAERLNREWDTEMTITTQTHHSGALDSAGFVILSIEVVPREELWQLDYEIPLRHGVRQPYSENGGPGGFAHAARNIGPVMEIVRDMEQSCPDAWLVNFTNPMMRICDAITRYSSIRVVGLCHQIRVGYAMVGLTLARDFGIEVPEGFADSRASPASIPARRQVTEQALELLEIKAVGLNHFTWMVDLRDRRSGQDLYPLFAERWGEVDPAFEPLTRRMYEIFGVFPIPGDQHLCEYLPWVSDPVTRPWDKYNLRLYEWDLWAQIREFSRDDVTGMADGRDSIDHLLNADSEGALEMIENIAGASNHYHMAVNLPNRGYIPNLPEGAIVEVPGLVSGAGVHGLGGVSLPDPVAELCRREIAVTRLCVDAAIRGDRQAALQCLLLDPVITDIDTAQSVLDDYLETYRKHLPQFWA